MIVIHPTLLKGVELKNYSLESWYTNNPEQKQQFVMDVYNTINPPSPSTTSDLVKSHIYSSIMENEYAYVWRLNINDELFACFLTKDSAEQNVRDMVDALKNDKQMFIINGDDKEKEVEK